jgi:hypothetical protein
VSSFRKKGELIKALRLSRKIEELINRLINLKTKD